MDIEDYDRLYNELYKSYYDYLERVYHKTKNENHNLLDRDFMIEFKSNIGKKRFSLYENWQASNTVINSYIRDITNTFYFTNYKRNKVLNFFVN